MRVLFFIPKDDEGGKFLNRKKDDDGIYIPLGVAQIAAVLRDSGHDVTVFDTRIEEESKVMPEVMKKDPDLVCMPLSYFNIKNASSIARMVKESFDVPIAVGGQYASVFYKDILKKGFIDYACIGDADLTVSEILDSFAGNRKINSVKGIAYRKKGRVVLTEEREEIDSLDSLPFPAYDLFPVQRYVPMPKNYKALPIMPVNTSRGCLWNRCTFCYQRGTFRRNSPGYVLELLKDAVSRFGVKEIRFWDDTFLDGSKWIDDFTLGMKRMRERPIWSCHARVNMVTKKTLFDMKEAGCWQIMFGIESGSQHLIDCVSKGITLEDAKKAVSLAKQAGLEVRVSFILGIPGETPEDAKKTINFAASLDADITQFSFFTPYPGTKAWEELKDDKRLDKDLTRYSEYRPVYVPEGYKDRKELEQMMKKAYRSIYLNPRYFAGRIRRLRNLTDIKKNYRGLKVALGMAYRKDE